MDEEYQALLAELHAGPATEALQAAANDLALRIRSRCIDLATWQADASPEYQWREEQCRTLAEHAGEPAYSLLKAEFGLR